MACATVQLENQRRKSMRRWSDLPISTSFPRHDAGDRAAAFHDRHTGANAAKPRSVSKTSATNPASKGSEALRAIAEPLDKREGCSQNGPSACEKT